MSRMMYRDRSQRVLTLQEYASILEADQDFSYRTVARSFDLPGGVAVSTVWRGVDKGDGLIFETMIFGGRLDGGTQEHITEHDAIQAHIWTTARVRRIENGVRSDGDAALMDAERLEGY